MNHEMIQRGAFFGSAMDSKSSVSVQRTFEVRVKRDSPYSPLLLLESSFVPAIGLANFLDLLLR